MTCSETGYRQNYDEHEDDLCMCESDKRCAACEAALARYRDMRTYVAPQPAPRRAPGVASIGNGLFVRVGRRA
jgi:hypothetical protein